MLGPFFHAPPPTDGRGKKVAWAVARLALVMGVMITLLSVVLPPWERRVGDFPQRRYQE